jgi:hypothetical protein
MFKSAYSHEHFGVSGHGTRDIVSTKLNNHHYPLYVRLYTCQMKRDQTSSSSHNDSALYGGFDLALLDLEFFWKMMHFYEACQCILCTHDAPNVTCWLGQEFGHVDLVFCLKQKIMLKSYDFMLNSHSLFHVNKVDKPKKKKKNHLFRKLFELNKAPTLKPMRIEAPKKT